MDGAVALDTPVLPSRPRWAAADIAMLMLRVVLSGGLLGLTLWLSTEQLAWRDFLKIDPSSIVICLLLSVAMVTIIGWRWRFVVARTISVRQIPSFSDFVGFTWVGLAVNQLVPSVVAGDALRVTLLARRGIPVSAATVSVVIDRFYGIAGLLVLCLATAPMLSLPLFYSTLTGAAFAAAALAIAAALAWWVARRHKLFQKLSTAVANGVSLRDMLIMVPAAMVVHLANIGIFLVIANAMGVDVPILPSIAILSGILLVSVLPVSVAGWGLREFALLNAFGQLGIDNDKIVLASVAYGLFLLVTQAAGFLMILRSKRT